MEHEFLVVVQKRLPHMLHSELIDHRRWVRTTKVTDEKRRRI